MSFYFRKLRRTLRLIPTTQSLSFIGYSTRVNEWDKNNVVTALLEGRSPSSSTPPNPAVSATTSEGCLTPANEIAHNLLPVIMPPASLLPVSYVDVQNILRSSSVKKADCPAKEIDFISEALKSVRLTSDDILVHPFGGPYDSDLIQSVSERIPVDILAPTLLPGSPVRDLNSSASEPQRKNSETFDDLCHGCHTRNISTMTPAAMAIGQIGHTVYFSSSESRRAEDSSNSSKDGPSPEQMQKARGKLEELVTNLFSGRHDYGILHKQVVLENNLFGDNKVCRGVTAYSIELLKLRVRIHARYSSTSMEIINVTSLEQSGVIRIHWRLKGVSQMQVLKFWRLFQSKRTISKEDWEWLEAFSYFHIGKDGLVHKHRIDRMMPDNERETNKLTEKLQGLLNPAKPLVS